MSKVKNINMKNRNLTTSFGKFHFDKNGVTEVPDEDVSKILSIEGYKLVEEPYEGDENGCEDDCEGKTSDKEEKIQRDDESDSNDGDSNDDEDEVKNSRQEYTIEELESKNVAQLKKIAKDNGVDLDGATRKDEIIAEIMEEIGKVTP